MSSTDWVTLIGAISLFITSLATSIATLITALKTHKAIGTSNGHTIGQLVESTNKTVKGTPPHG